MQKHSHISHEGVGQESATFLYDATAGVSVAAAPRKKKNSSSLEDEDGSLDLLKRVSKKAKKH